MPLDRNNEQNANSSLYSSKIESKQRKIISEQVKKTSKSAIDNYKREIKELEEQLKKLSKKQAENDKDLTATRKKLQEDLSSAREKLLKQEAADEERTARIAAQHRKNAANEASNYQKLLMKQEDVARSKMLMQEAEMRKASIEAAWEEPIKEAENAVRRALDANRREDTPETKAAVDRARKTRTNLKKQRSAQIKNAESEYNAVYEKVEQEEKELRILEKLNPNTVKAQKEAESAASVETKTAAALADVMASSNMGLIKKFSELNKIVKEFKEQESDEAESEKGALGTIKSIFKEGLLGAAAGKIAEGISNTLGPLVNKADEQIDGAASLIAKYMSSFDARLQGSNKYSEGIFDLVRANLAASPYLTQQKMLESIAAFVDNGVVYNLEQRAYLSALADKMVTTFNALDANLTRLIRLQQADMTQAALGVEASLTKLFNRLYEDTSYLSDGTGYDTTTASILDAAAQLDYKEASSFLYTVQKWLGALSALGISTTATNTIATGLNYLGTGNISELNNNHPLQTLLAMSASKAGLSYADILVEGLDVKTTNELLKSMVEYLAEIAGNQNKVVLSSYGEVLGLNISDFRAIQNLTEYDLKELYQANLSYEKSISEALTQLGEVKNRTHVSEEISNAVNNAIFTISSDIADDTASYVIWKSIDLVRDVLTGGAGGSTGIKIVDAALTLAQTGMLVGFGIGNIVDIGKTAFGGVTSYDAWGGTLTQGRSLVNQRGENPYSGFGGNRTSGTFGGGRKGISYSASISNGSASEVFDTSVASRGVEAKAQGNDAYITASQKDIGDMYYQLFTARDIPIKVHLESATTAAGSSLRTGFGTLTINGTGYSTTGTFSGSSSSGFSSDQAGSVGGGRTTASSSKSVASEDGSSETMLAKILSILESEGVAVIVKNDNFDYALQNLSRPN